MAGGLVVSSVLTIVSRGRKYCSMLYLVVTVSTATPLIVLLVPANPQWYSLVFLCSGIAYSVSQIVFSRVLLEISTNENRALYTGLSGARSFMNILYPLVAVSLIPTIEYIAVFIMTALYNVIGLYVAKTIHCPAYQDQDNIQDLS